MPGIEALEVVRRDATLWGLRGDDTVGRGILWIWKRLIGRTGGDEVSIVM